MLVTFRLKIRPFSDSDLKNRFCVVPENIHTPTTEGIGNSEGGGGQRLRKFQRGGGFRVYKYAKIVQMTPLRLWRESL